MPTIQATPLTNFVSDIFQAATAPAAHARQVASSLVGANLTGHDSHGVIRVVQYLGEINEGTLDPAAAPQISSETGAITVVDGCYGFGQMAAKFAMQTTIEKAETHRLAATTLTHCNHIGRVGEWVEMAAQQNLVGLAFCNGGRAGGLVTPFGGVARRLGTNPFAAAVPVGDGPPFLLDFATSVVAEGKVRVALNSDQQLPPGYILDQDGTPSTTPQDLYDGGMLLPAAGYKGYGLSMLIELLGGILSGQGSPALADFPGVRNGVLFIVLSIEAFRPLEGFLEHSQNLQDKIKDTPTDATTPEVLIPGEPERRMAAHRQANGIPINETTWEQLKATAQSLGVSITLN